MNCPDYLEQLDAVAPGSGDHEDPGVREAVAHLAECDRCSREFEFRREFDRRVARQVREVELPAGARERLQARLNEVKPVQPDPVDAAVPSRRFRRRFVLKALSAIAAVALVAVGIYFVWPESGATMSMAVVDEAVVEQFGGVTIDAYDGLEEFDGSFEASIDDGRWRSETNRSPRGVDLDGDERHDAAVYWMRGAPGVLLVLSPDLVSDPPTEATARGAVRRYSPVRVAWTPSGGKVHLCVLTRDADDGALERLLHRVIDAMAA